MPLAEPAMVRIMQADGMMNMEPWHGKEKTAGTSSGNVVSGRICPPGEKRACTNVLAPGRKAGWLFFFLRKRLIIN